ncbi:MAG: N-6 DNA methylase [Phycisphaerales bacterium]|nr:N-6 DNA methylase [Phycisphaerales bacterium]
METLSRNNSRWVELEASGRLEGMKETTLRPHFLQEIFTDALHYVSATENQTRWHIHHEFPINNGSADAAIGWFSAENGRPRAVVEIKGPTVNLDRDRSQGRTPVEQLWGYLDDLPDCPWGILSNCVSFRLYHRNHTRRAYELFVLQELRSPDVFRQFYALFERCGLLPATMAQKPRADVLLTQTENRQKEVGDDLYDAYSQQRQSLVRHLHTKHNKSVGEAIHIAQRVIDRIVFIAFCEDRKLLNEDTLRTASNNIPPFTRVTNPRWRNFVELFRSIDSGNKRQGIPPYNGGLFREDPEVDDLQLDDDWTDFFKQVGGYDFRDEVNVDVLGHLFERSITELERYRAGGLFDVLPARTKKGAMPKSAQRKRLGTYYTPPEFTELLMTVAVDAVISQRYDAVARAQGIDPTDDAARLHLADSADYWRDCLAALRDVKVCDPACGSGAFLIRAYEHFDDCYGEIVEKLTALKARDVRDFAEAVPYMILADNLFGVDLSEEAVEITQLALWIRSARRNRTLADLSRNIVCGNSLVDDSNVDSRAMKWEETFPAAFQRPQCGFDCVVGNPPWERIKLQEREFFSLSVPTIASAISAAKRRAMIEQLERKNPVLHARYVAAKQRAERILEHAHACGRYALTANGDLNTYMLFAELARNIVAPDGRVGLLVPSGIATDHTTRGFFTELISKQSLILLYDFENKRPYFPDVHRSFKFSALAFGGANVHIPDVDFLFFARDMEEIANPKRHIPLSTADLALMNPNTRTCPIFRSRRDAELTRKV